MNFIISSPRSGSTWLKTALNAHHEIYCTENRIFGMYFDLVQDDNRPDPRLRITMDKYINCLSEHFEWRNVFKNKNEFINTTIKTFVESLFSNSLKLVDKTTAFDKITPYNGTAVKVTQKIKEVFPEARLFFLFRDGRDVILSGTFHWLNKTKLTDSPSPFEIKRKDLFTGKHTGIVLERFFTDDDITELATNWFEIHEAFKQQENKIAIFYEDMLQNLSGVLSQLLTESKNDCSETALQQCLDASTFKKMSGGRSQGQGNALAHVRKGIAGEWNQYFTKLDGEIFNSIAGEALIDLQYETDNSWVNKLPDKLNLRK